ncbi:MAG: hypothetical protein RL061_739 [Pseudomonadota bacterium]|jgi:peptidyl-prolyl cis-trans isomerase D
MLESIRKYQKLLMGLLLLLILPSFVFLGVETYMRDLGKDTDLVKIDGQSITRQELDNAVKARADRLQQQGRKADSAMLNSVPFKQSVLNELMQQRLLAFEIKSLKLKITPETLAKDLTQIPEIRALYKDGQFDTQRYKQLLAGNQMTVDQFENGRRYELLSRQVITSVLATGISSRKVAEKISQAFETEREVQVMRFAPADFISKVTPTQQDLDAFYQANINAFQAPEMIDVELVVLLGNAKDDPKAFAEKADLFANMAYEQPDSLKPVADRLKLAIQSVKGVTRGGARGLPADHPLNNPKLLAAVFSDDAIKNRRNIEAQEVSPGKIVVARVSNHQAQAALPLSAVQTEVKKQVSLRLADELASKVAQEKLQALQKNPAEATGFSSAKWVSRNKPTDLNAPAMDAIMAPEVSKLPVVVSAPLNGGGLAIYRVTKIQQPIKSDSKLRVEQAMQLAQLGTQAEGATYFDGVRERAGLKQINQVK